MVKIIDEAAVLKALEGLSEEEKIKKLVTKLVESERNSSDAKAKNVQVDKLTKAKDSLEKKLDKANQILVRTEESKGKLEELCRGLQALNKQIRDEHAAKIKKLETERAEAVLQMKSTLKGIEESMTAGKEKSDALAEDNRKLAAKFEELGQQYKERASVIEQQYEKKEQYWQEYGKAKDIEIKLLKTKLEAASITVQKAGLEKDELAKTLIDETARMGSAIETEKVLREQVQSYAAKYTDLASCLSKSNETFDKFKKEIDRVNSNCRKVEQDVNQWRKKYDEANQKVLVLTMTNQEYAEKIVLSDKRIEKLESLCRALQKGQQTKATGSDDQQVQ